jgi:hypothetical protein
MAKKKGAERRLFYFYFLSLSLFILSTFYIDDVKGYESIDQRHVIDCSRLGRAAKPIYAPGGTDKLSKIN